MLKPKCVPAGVGAVLQVLGGDVVTIKLSGADSEGSMVVLETVTPSGMGPPPHCHWREDESFYVLEGRFDFHVGGTVVPAGPGSYLFAPRGVPHFFRNVGDSAGRLLIHVQPAGIEAFFEELSRLPPDGPPPPEVLADFHQRYGIEFLPSA